MNLPLHEIRLCGPEVLRYRVYGQGPRRLLLVHGLASRSQVWSDLVPLFPGEIFTLYLLDLLGSGESSKPAAADYSIPAQGARIVRFVQLLGLSGAAAVGHSLGGSAVLLAAMQETGLFSSLALIGAPGFIQRLPLIASILRAPLAAGLFVHLPFREAWVRRGLLAAYHDPALANREHLERYLPCYRQRDAKRALVATCRSIVPRNTEELTRGYASVRTPTLLLWGSGDRIVRVSQGERLAAALPAARLELIPRCGHNP
ncbi:MAG TPA: alpha/beta fold hydrolase, partial [Verrucomicrobiae bacterium]|nr:alpha/beta fold hydrolase [Verrucomicrobiae bacterium]